MGGAGRGGEGRGGVGRGGVEWGGEGWSGEGRGGVGRGGVGWGGRGGVGRVNSQFLRQCYPQGLVGATETGLIVLQGSGSRGQWPSCNVCRSYINVST